MKKLEILNEQIDKLKSERTRVLANIRTFWEYKSKNKIICWQHKRYWYRTFFTKNFFYSRWIWNAKKG